MRVEDLLNEIQALNKEKIACQLEAEDERVKNRDLENEFHVPCVCPEYAQARRDLTDRLQLGRLLNTCDGFCQLLATDDTHKLSVVCNFLIRARQTRRRLKTTFEQLNEKFITLNFASKHTA